MSDRRHLLLAAALAAALLCPPAAAQATRTLAFQPQDPYVVDQWYLTAIRAFDFWSAAPAPVEPVLVAVIDSGIDASHPEFAGRIERLRSFVSTPAREDSIGHGTVVAGEIAAALDNAEGIAGVGFAAKLLVAKVVRSDGSISLEAEAKAIRWAVRNGARVINLSLSGPRSPFDPERDTYSRVEHAAIEHATRHGALVVAATGNCVAVCPYGYASYPAALPHVLGVSALSAEERTPGFSNRDAIYNDLAAPGKGIFSTFPLALSLDGCAQPGYTVCAQEEEYRLGEGTSFAAPLVSAAAALLLSVRPDLAPSQLSALLERSAIDVGKPGRDKRSGWGRLDVAEALALLAAGPLPPADRYEPNDGAGERAYRLYLSGSRREVRKVTLDFYDDPVDVYAVRLRRGQRLVLRLVGPPGATTDLVLWAPDAEDILDHSPESLGRRLRRSDGVSRAKRVSYRAQRSGWYAVEIRVASEGGSGPYWLIVERHDH